MRTFDEQSVVRIARTVRAVERASGGGRFRRGKFDDDTAATTASFPFRVTVADDEGTDYVYVQDGLTKIIGEDWSAFDASAFEDAYVTGNYVWLEYDTSTEAWALDSGAALPAETDELLVVPLAQTLDSAPGRVLQMHYGNVSAAIPIEVAYCDPDDGWTIRPFSVGNEVTP